MEDFGGVTGSAYATLYNTPGIGDVMPPCNGCYGSGDRFDNTIHANRTIKPKKKEVTNNMLPPMDVPLIVYTKK